MNTLFDYAFIGGDARLAYMADLLEKKGLRVTAYGQDMSGIANTVVYSGSLEEAVRSAGIVIGPVPFTRDGINILSKVHQEDLTIEQLKKVLTPDNMFFAGCIPQFLKDFGRNNSIFMYDYMKNEELTIYNTIATAEGAIADAIALHPENLHGSRALILGYGRCAKTLAAKLRGLCGTVAVCARNKNMLAEASAYGFEVFDFSSIYENIQSFDYIFNTVPQIVLDYETLKLIRKDALIIDIAPGGFEMDKAAALGLNAHLSLGLPGRYAPRSSAKALVDVTMSEVNSHFE